MGAFIGGDGSTATVAPTPIVQMRETISLVQREVEDLSWVNVSGEDSYRTLDDPYDTRNLVLRRARLYAKRSPLARVAIGLVQHYVLGQGLTVKAHDKQQVAKLVDEFMNDPINRAILTSHQAMKEFLEALYVDGDYFLVLFVDQHLGTLQLGMKDALLVEDIIKDPQNAKITKWYKVKQGNTEYNFEQGALDTRSGADFVYYRDWQNSDDKPANMPASKLMPGLMYQVSLDKRGKWGRSQLATALDWLKAHREFMEDRATMNRAAAAFAWKKKRNGPAGDVAAEAARLQSALVNNPFRYETNPPGASGSTVIENAGSTLEWIKTDTGGAAADFDERKLRMMTGSGLGGIPNHYFGDEGAANLATATAMEMPLLKMMEDYQQTLRDVILDLVTFMLTSAEGAGRVGPRDDSAKYADRTTTPQAVMDSPDQDDAAGATGGRNALPPMDSLTEGQRTAVLALREAEANLREALNLPFAPAPSTTLRLIPRPDTMPTPAPKTPSVNEPVDWACDVDYPPMIQKELFSFMQALQIAATILPTEVLESKKWLVEQILGAFSGGDLEATMARIFPANMVAVQMPATPPPAFGQLGPGNAQNAQSGKSEPLPPDKDASDTADKTGVGGGSVAGPIGEARSLSQYRIQRMIKIAGAIDQAAEDLPIAVGMESVDRLREQVGQLVARSDGMERLAEAIANRPIQVSSPVTVHPAAISVTPAEVHMAPEPIAAPVRLTMQETRFVFDEAGKIVGKTVTERPVEEPTDG